MRVSFEQIKPHIGAIVHVERAALCDEDVVAQCLEQLEDRGVLVFPKIDLSDAEQLAFTDKLGGRVNYCEGMPLVAQDVYKVTMDEALNEFPDTVMGTWFWHMDGTTVDQLPPKASLLSARRLAPKGGDTEFASSFAGYETLSAEEKAEIDGLRAFHTMAASMRPVKDAPTDAERKHYAAHTKDRDLPIVWKQKSGRKSLVIGQSADYIVDKPVPDGRAVLARLMDWTAQPDFTYRHRWHLGDMLIWNNPGVLHRATPYDRKSGRAMHRTTVAGIEPVV